MITTSEYAEALSFIDHEYNRAIENREKAITRGDPITALHMKSKVRYLQIAKITLEEKLCGTRQEAKHEGKN